MPVVIVEMWEGRDIEQKKQLVEGITSAMTKIGISGGTYFGAEIRGGDANTDSPDVSLCVNHGWNDSIPCSF